MKYLKPAILSILLLIAFSCKEKEGSDFTNKLTFGTSINYNDFTLKGEGDSFSALAGNVAFRLESAEDFNGNPVKFVVLKNGFTYSTETYDNNPKPSGHIFLTTLNYTQKASYSVTAYIQKITGDQLVATGSFQMN